ncbi:MAG: FtsX-like permease family protein, partial [Gemmatimonas sp.]
RPLKLGTITFGSFALLTVILSAVGLYGVLAFSVTQRAGEFGIRAALGARASHLVRNVVGEGIAIVAVGIVVGAAISWYASNAIAAILFEASARDAAPYIAAAAIFGCVALIASALPAWRATRIDPASALRAE